MKPSRKLLTVLAADVVGYSKMIEHDEEGALKQLSKVFSLARNVIESQNGRIANTAGDSIVAAFESPVEAVKAALSIQEKLGAQPEQTDKRQPSASLRIGINMGDVALQENGDILGHGVNIAARLEALAEPGGVCISDNVINHVKNIVDFEFSKIGQHYVKNIEKPVVVYTTSSSARHWSRRVRNTLANIYNSYVLRLASIALTFLTMAFLVWSMVSVKNGNVLTNSDVKAALEQASDRSTILQSFDLVTEGQLGTSEYYVIRTWGGELSEFLELADKLGGHLVTINSPEENDYVYNLTLSEDGHWFMAAGNAIGPMIGLVQSPDGAEPDAGWGWSNGEAVTYTNWKKYGPDNSGGRQDLANFQGREKGVPAPTWNDFNGNPRSIILEIPAF